jgi:hypothetical protein
MGDKKRARNSRAGARGSAPREGVLDQIRRDGKARAGHRSYGRRVRLRDIAVTVGSAGLEQVRAQSREDRVVASMQGELQPSVYRFKLGDFEITNILDGKAFRDGLHPSFGREQSAEAAQALCRANAIDANRYVHPFIPTLVNTGNELILFDTGNGALPRDYPQLRGRISEGGLVGAMAQAGYRPSDVDVVVVTHGHPDHIGGLMDGGKPVFPNARYVFGAAEFDFWKRGARTCAKRASSISSCSRSLLCRLRIALASSSRATRLRPVFAPSTPPAIRRGCWPITSKAKASVL